MKPLTLLLAALMIISCQQNSHEESSQSNTQPDTSEVVDAAHTSQNALDWAGTYTGVIPCADCAGIKLKVVLDMSGHFLVEQQYSGKSEDIIQTKGRIQWAESGNELRLNGIGDDNSSLKFAVEENRLRKLDIYGKKIDGELADQYLLHQSDNSITNKYWQVIQLDGKPIVINKSEDNQPHIIVWAGDRVSGYTGCNQLTGTYQLKSDSGINFSQMASTKRACEKMERESQILEALTQANNYMISGGILSLRKDKGPAMIKFKYDFFKTPTDQ